MLTLSANPPNSAILPTWRRKVIDFAIARRIPISLFAFIALIVEDVLAGVRPHDIFNYRDPMSVLGFAIIVAGLAMRSWAAGILRKSMEVSTAGPYNIIRHPLYVGSFLMMIGFCVLIDDAENIWFVLGPFALLYALSVLSEERMLAGRFGAQWTDYAARTPRFLPRRMPSQPLAAWSRKQWLGNREYRAIGASGLGLLALKLWQLS